MGALEIAILAAVAGWFVFAVIYLIRHKGGCSCGGKKGCPHGCGSCCGDCDKCRRERKDDGNN